MQPVTTLVPSSTPSITGLIATFDISKTVTTQLSDAEINSIETEIMNEFDVNHDEIDTTGN